MKSGASYTSSERQSKMPSNMVLQFWHPQATTGYDPLKKYVILLAFKHYSNTWTSCAVFCFMSCDHVNSRLDFYGLTFEFMNETAMWMCFLPFFITLSPIIIAVDNFPKWKEPIMEGRGNLEPPGFARRNMVGHLTNCNALTGGPFFGSAKWRWKDPVTWYGNSTNCEQENTIN